jgi:hypothetical protein
MVERLGLGQRAWETIEQHALVRVGLMHALDDHGDDQIVRHQRAAIHIALGLPPELVVFRPVCTEQIATGDVGDAVLRGDATGLGALAGPDWPEEDQIETATVQ